MDADMSSLVLFRSLPAPKLGFFRLIGHGIIKVKVSISQRTGVLPAF